MTDKKDQLPRKERLIEAGKKLFSNKGFNSTSVRDLAQEANCNVSMISYYFGGKEQLYSAVVDQFATEIRSFLSVKDVTSMSPVEKIRYYAAKVMKMHGENPQLAHILNHEMNSPTRILEIFQRELFPVVFKFLEESFEEGMAKGLFRSDLDPAVMSYSLASMVNFYYLQNELVRRINPNIENRGSKIIDDALDIFLNGICTSGKERC